MKYAFSKVILFAIVFAIFIYAFPSRAAAGPEDYYSIDVFVIMDSSNSMRYNDTQGLRFDAFRDFASQLETGDRIGLFQFGANTQMTIPLTEINEETRQELSAVSIPDINLIYTDTKDALQKAYDEMRRLYDSEHLPFFIVFTDGDLQPVSGYESNTAFKQQYLAELNELAEKFHTKGWPMYAIDLDRRGEPGDPDLKSAVELSGGYMVNIRSAEEIQNTFREVLQSIRKKKVDAEVELEIIGKNGSGLELKVTAPDPGDYSLFNNMDIRAEVMLNGKRIVQGQHDDFKINDFYAEIKTSDGIVIRRDLMDDGEVVNGDMYAGDGVYSAFFKPGKEGEFTLSVHVRGEYKDISFEQHKDLEGFRAVPAGKVIFSLPDISEIILNPGKVNIVEIQADSQSSRTERLEFSLADSDEITMQPYAAYLINNRINVLELEINVPENTPVGQKGQLVFKVGSMNYDTILSHDTITIDYVIEPAKTSPVLPIVLGGLALAAAGFLIIKIIRKMIIKMASYVKGSLVYWKGSDIDKKEQINLSRFRSERVRLCTLPGEKVRQIADLGEAVDLVFYTESSGKGVSYFVSGGIDNILYTADNVPHKILKLENGLIFRVNSLYFQYNNPKVEAQSGPGVNVLEKYGIDL